jgi:hypothetical protein
MTFGASPSLSTNARILKRQPNLMLRGTPFEEQFNPRVSSVLGGRAAVNRPAAARSASAKKAAATRKRNAKN